MKFNFGAGMFLHVKTDPRISSKVSVFSKCLKNEATAHWAEIKLAYTKKISSN
tara:strand:+ start:237 stop:395 length:159 start_codon:yes stop_codon:yes gene_type:complete